MSYCECKHPLSVAVSGVLCMCGVCHTCSLCYCTSSQFGMESIVPNTEKTNWLVWLLSALECWCWWWNACWLVGHQSSTRPERDLAESLAHLMGSLFLWQLPSSSDTFLSPCGLPCLYRNTHVPSHAQACGLWLYWKLPCLFSSLRNRPPEHQRPTQCYTVRRRFLLCWIQIIILLELTIVCASPTALVGGGVYVHVCTCILYVYWFCECASQYCQLWCDCRSYLVSSWIAKDVAKACHECQNSVVKTGVNQKCFDDVCTPTGCLP